MSDEISRGETGISNRALKLQPAPLLESSEAPPYELLRGEALAPQLVVCDHSSGRIPRSLGKLGLAPEHRESHIALDIGAGELTRALSERLGATAVLCNYSRLVVDCNRSLSDLSAFLDLSAGVPVPGNMNLSEDQKARRAAAIHVPYHQAIDRELDRLAAVAGAPVLIAVHSFARVLAGKDRRWDCGVLWDLDDRIARPLLDGLRSSGELLVGDNLPYSGKHPEDYTVDHHAEERRFPCAALEVCQDLLDSADKVQAMADRLYRILKPILDDPSLYMLRA